MRIKVSYVENGVYAMMGSGRSSAIIPVCVISDR